MTEQTIELGWHGPLCFHSINKNNITSPHNRISFEYPQHQSLNHHPTRFKINNLTLDVPSPTPISLTLHGTKLSGNKKYNFKLLDIVLPAHYKNELANLTIGQINTTVSNEPYCYLLNDEFTEISLRSQMTVASRPGMHRFPDTVEYATTLKLNVTFY